MMNTNEIVNEAIEHVTTEAIDDVADAIVANDVAEVNGGNGIGLIEAGLMITGGAALIYVAVKGVKWAAGKLGDLNEIRKAKKAAKIAAKQQNEIVAEVEAEEADCDDAVEA